MDTAKSISFASLVLATVAGYCDTATFVAGHGIFSAHVTGNFVVFAAQVASGQDASAYIKLLTFPVFIIAVIFGGWLIRRKQPVLLFQGLLLLLCGLLALGIKIWNNADSFNYGIVMLTVAAMGLQNAFGKLFAKATHGPTTMMTGNVTQAALDIGSLILGKATDRQSALQSLIKSSTTITGFLFGCIAGALMGRYFGLSCLAASGIAMIWCYFAVPKHSYELNQ